MYKLGGQEMNVKKLCRKESTENHEDHSGFHLSGLLYLPLYFSFWIYLWWYQMLTLSYLKQPVRYFQGSAVPGYFLQLLIWSHCTQQSNWSTVGQGQIPPGVGATVSPQADAAQEGSGLPEDKSCCHLWHDSASGSQFSPQSFSP